MGEEMLEEVESEWLMADWNLLREEREDPTLSCAWEQVTMPKRKGAPTNEHPKDAASMSTMNGYTG